MLPNLQKGFEGEKKQSFLNFLPKNTKIWFKDIQLTYDTIDKYFSLAEDNFRELLDQSNNTQVVQDPDILFETSSSFSIDIVKHDVIEFGHRFHFEADSTFSFSSEPQPSFHKDFNLIAANLDENQLKGVRIIIASDSFKQTERLISIFEEIDPELSFETLNISLRNGFIDSENKILCYTDHQLFERYHKYKSQEKYTKVS